ncbi:hypothetical protein JG677_00065 [Campylobacter sp. TTU-622]|uniref:hypothetical protein n=1 Tax=Campylobacter sp. TTU-622 TaxID=2800583 RepID=UPI0019083CF6|nr:hypothetical protein [Campylobacter sp. TTU-622]MBK1972474.1 hypothetical protein [Campylobacter sp. TTU-622]
MREIIAVKKDFIAFNKKSFCQDRLLTSGKAYYLHYKDNNKFCGYAGKECVKQKCSNDLNIVPDFTKSLISNFKKETKIIQGKKHIHRANLSKSDISMAIEYVILRQSKMKKFKKANYFILNDYYKEYLKTNTLSLNSIKHILNIEEKAPLKFKLDNLLTCYAYEYKILLALKNIPINKRAYLISILSNLRQYYTLTDKQIEGLKEWFKRIKNKEIAEAKLKKFLYAKIP